MRSKAVGTFFGLCAGYLIAASSAASADAFADCVRAVASQDLASRAAFQRDLRDLVVGQRPEFAALADINMELQTLLAQAQRVRLDYLLEHAPGRLDTASGPAGLTNFDWSDADQAHLMAASGAYRALGARLATARESNNGHPDWPEMRAYFRSQLSRGADYAAIMARLQDRQKDIAAALAQCRR